MSVTITKKTLTIGHSCETLTTQFEVERYVVEGDELAFEATLKLDKKIVVRLVLEWQRNAAGQFNLFVRSFDNYASSRSSGVKERFTDTQIESLRGIGHRMFCLLLDIVTQDENVQSGNDTLVRLVAESQSENSTVEDDKVLARYYETFGFQHYDNPDVDEGIPMRATVKQLRMGCERRLAKE